MRSLILRIVLILSFFCFACPVPAEDSPAAGISADSSVVSTEDASSASGDKTVMPDKADKEDSVDDEHKREIQTIRKSLRGAEKKRFLWLISQEPVKIPAWEIFLSAIRSS